MAAPTAVPASRRKTVLLDEHQNVAFSFVTGLLFMTFGMNGRVSGCLPHDNPYSLSRHPRPSS